MCGKFAIPTSMPGRILRPPDRSSRVDPPYRLLANKQRTTAAQKTTPTPTKQKAAIRSLHAVCFVTRSVSVKAVSSPRPESRALGKTSKVIRQISAQSPSSTRRRLLPSSRAPENASEPSRATRSRARKSHAELRPELVALVRQLRRKRPKGGQRSLREISAELAARGHLNERGVPFSAASIASMLG
jgi:hypothetical protein